MHSGDLRLERATPGEPIELWVDGNPILAFDGETVLTALWAAGIRALHRTARFEEPRGPFCAIGVCFDCLVTVDGSRNVRACMTRAIDGARIELQRDAGVLGPGGVSRAR